MDTQIPFVDLRAQHEQVRSEIEAAISDIIDRSSFIGGSYVANFERQFDEFIGVREAVAVANGTDALWLALVANGIGAGDAVVTVPNTFIATVEAITRAGAQPLFVDIDLQTSNIDLQALNQFLEENCIRQDDGQVIHKGSRLRVAAVMPVHLYGLPVDIASLQELADSYGLVIIEDACQAHGARYKIGGEWRRAGSVGKAAGFSFYPGKNLGAMGDGGAVVTNDAEMAQKMRWLRDHGSSEKYIHETADGWNSRLDAIQAAILSIKLKKLDEWNTCRRQAADLYRKVLAGLPLELPVEPEYAEPVYHLFVVRMEDRERLRKQLAARGVGVGLHYPIPLHLQKAYNYMGLQEGSYPKAELSASTVLSLPIHPFLKPGQIQTIGKIFAELLD